MKRINYTCCFLILIAMLLSFCSRVEAKQNFEFYYQTVTNVEDIGTGAQDGDNLLDKIGKGIKQGINDIKEAWNEGVTNSDLHKTGEQKWYSGRTKNLLYTVNRVKITSREDLIEKIGVPEDKMTDGQKAMLNLYDMASSDAIDERSKYSYRDPIRVVITDTTDADWSYTDVNGKTQTVPRDTYQSDFWSWSNGNTIHMATHNFNSKAGMEDVKSTFLHEYCHAIDKTNKEWIKPYGKDGSHYGDEMSKPKAAFVEGWAEYNEMIEFSAVATDSLKQLDKVCVELSEKEAKNFKPEDAKNGWFCNGVSTYTYKLAKDLTPEELWSCESYNRAALYYFATKLDNGKQKVYDAFIKSRGKIGRDLKTFVKELCKQHPEDIDEIGRILDDLSYGKMTDKEMKKFIGNSKEAKAFLKERAAGYPNDKKEETSAAASVISSVDEDESAVPELTGTSDEEGSVFNIK